MDKEKKMDNEKKIDLTTYPEGFNEVLKSLSFLPEDPAVRIGYLINFCTILFYA